MDSNCTKAKYRHGCTASPGVVAPFAEIIARLTQHGTTIGLGCIYRRSDV
jgi:hypothetical protein